MRSTYLVPVKGDRSDEEAVKLACDLARVCKGKVIVLYVIQVERELPVDAEVTGATAKGEEILKRIEEITKDQHCEIEAELLQAREVGPAVVQEAMEREAETIVMGTLYKMKYGSFNLGEAVPYILKNAPCSVILWRGAMEQNNNQNGH